jgi:hypothetical protein
MRFIEASAQMNLEAALKMRSFHFVAIIHAALIARKIARIV